MITLTENAKNYLSRTLQKMITSLLESMGVVVLGFNMSGITRKINLMLNGVNHMIIV